MSDQLARITAALSDRYKIERELGRGGMATVYLAEDLKHRRQVAIKVLRPELVATVGVERFLREIDIAAQLSHPHILPLLDSGRTGGQSDGRTDDLLFYVMPFVEGESLREKLARERELPIADAVRILRDVVDALALAHSRGVIHRDIKPDNVMLSGRHALVTDFGVAKALSKVSRESDLTTAGVALGTPAYMSPEQAVADEQIDHRSDIYAVGALGYELLTGRPPFLGTTPQMVLSAHVADPPDPVTKYRENVSPPLEQLVIRCLEKKPADRWQSADELLAQLEAVVTPSGGLTPTTTRPVSAARVRGRKRFGLATAVAIAATGAVMVLGGVWLAPKLIGPRATEAETELPRLVVLPFENLGSSEDESFADGITDEISARLAGLDNLAVISRQSAIQYKNTEKTPRQIGDELDADYLLEGTIRWQHSDASPSIVRITPQLIRIDDDTQIWAEVYDSPLTEVFAVQSDIAERMVSAMGIALGSNEGELLAAMPTQSLEAYEHYLRGNAAFNKGYPGRPELREAVEQYEMAVASDPSFALALAKLSITNGHMFFNGMYSNPEEGVQRLARAEETALEALRLEPGLPEGHAALGAYHYHCCRDFDRALAELDVALQRQPTNPLVLMLSVGPLMRSGQIERAAELSSRASDLDPLAFQHALSALQTNLALRNYDLAERFIDRFGVLYPGEWPMGYVFRAHLALKREGNPETVREIFEQAEEHSGVDRWEIVVVSGPPASPMSLKRVLCTRDPDACRQATTRAVRDSFQVGLLDAYLRLAELYQWAGDEHLSRVYYDSAATAAAVRLEEVLRLERPGEEHSRQMRMYRLEGRLALIHAALGNEAVALQHLDRRQELKSIVTDRWVVLTYRDFTSEAYVKLGEYDAALAELESRLSTPSDWSVPLLRVDPLWVPLRDDPRFQALLERYGN